MEGEWSKFPRQRVFSFAHEPGYNRKGASFVPDDERFEGWEPDNIYHVTTNLRGVIGSGRLKSRNELGGQVGLGGGWKNEAPNAISATYNYSRALSIYHEFKYVLEIIAGKVRPSQIWDNFASDNSHHPFFDDFELTMDESRAVFDLLRQWGIPKKNIMDGDMDAVMDKKIVGPENIYRFFQELETIFHDAGGDYDNATPQNVIGFTGDFDAMRRIDPRQLAILQLAVKKDAKVSHEPIELELRINPEDVAVVRYLQPA